MWVEDVAVCREEEAGFEDPMMLAGPFGPVSYQPEPSESHKVTFNI